MNRTYKNKIKTNKKRTTENRNRKKIPCNLSYQETNTNMVIYFKFVFREKVNLSST